jgi:hypothetical protein
MAKYTSDGNLIQGAATAYKNYDNAPGMYAGLDKVIEQGNKVFEEQMEKRRVVEKKFDDASEGVLMRSGALGKTLYGTATEDAKKFRELYIEGINTKDPSKKMEAMVALQNLSDFVQDHKQTNLDVAESRKNKELSSYYEDSPAGRKKAEIMTQIQDQKYSKVSENEEGQKQFHVTVDGEEILVTNKEYKEMASTIRNYTTGNSYMGALDNAREQEIFSDDIFAQRLKPDLPRDNNEWDATAYDDVIAGNKNLPKMLNDSQSLDQEIISALGQDAYQKFDTDGESYYEDKDGNKIQGLSPDEKAAFIDAVVNSENPLFNLETSNQILIDQLTNAGRNSHTAHWKKINDEKAIKEQKALEKDKSAINRQKNIGKVYLGLGKVNSSKIYLPPEVVIDKVKMVNNSEKGDLISGWEGSKTTRYQHIGNGKFTYQEWDTEEKRFKTVAKYGGKATQLTREQVIADLNVPPGYGGASATEGWDANDY